MDQEPIAVELPNHQQPLQELPFDVSLLRLDGGKSTAMGDHNQPPNTSCGCKCNCSSVKRPSPEPSSERHTKKSNYDSHSLCDFSVLPLPPTSLPTLRGCDSGPYTAPRPSTSLTRDSLVAQSPPEDAKIVTDSPMSKGGSSSLPTKPPLPWWSIADTPPSPNKNSSRSSGLNEIIKEESTRIQRWQRMKDRLKEMTECLEEMREGEEMKVTEDSTKDENEEEEEEEEEAVWVERKGERLVIHFKCPCSQGYQILLSGGMCYYKLM